MSSNAITNLQRPVNIFTMGIQQEFNSLKDRILHINTKKLSSNKSEKIIEQTINFIIKLKPDINEPSIENAENLNNFKEIMNELDKKSTHNDNQLLISYILLVEICKGFNERQDLIEKMYYLFTEHLIFIIGSTPSYEHDEHISMTNTIIELNNSTFISPSFKEEIKVKILSSAVNYGAHKLLNDMIIYGTINFTNDYNILELTQIITIKTTPQNAVIHLELICHIFQTNLSNLSEKIDILKAFILYCGDLLTSEKLKYEYQEVARTITEILTNFIRGIEESTKITENSDINSIVQREKVIINLLTTGLVEKILNANLNDLLGIMNNPSTSNTKLKNNLNQLINLATTLIDQQMNIEKIIELVNFLYKISISPNASNYQETKILTLCKKILQNTTSLPPEQCTYIEEIISKDTPNDFIDVGLENELKEITDTYKNEHTIFIQNDDGEDYLIINTDQTTINNNKNLGDTLHNLHEALQYFHSLLITTNVNNYHNKENEYK